MGSKTKWSAQLRPALVIGMFLTLEVLVAIVIEPLLLSQRAGVSKVALLGAVTFWTWLWGPTGLLLAMPLTVCLIVLARYVPELEFIAVMLGDEPALPPRLAFYQRLLAKLNEQESTLESLHNDRDALTTNTRRITPGRGTCSRIRPCGVGSIQPAETCQYGE